MRDLHLELDPALGRRNGLIAGLRRAIHAGALSPGTRLPSSRSLAVELGMARATVVGAFEQLAAEGFLESRRGSGTRVAAGRLLEQRDDASPPIAAPAVADFRPGEPDVTSFPRAAWASTTRAVLSGTPAATFAYGAPGGLVELRRALAAAWSGTCRRRVARAGVRLQRLR